MTNKKIFVIATLVLLLLATTWFGWQHSQPQTPTDEALAAPAIPAPAAASTDPVAAPVPAPLPKPVLNLEIPEEHFLMDTTVEVPEKESWLKGLFTPRAKEKSVKVGGGLILDEKPADPNAAIWDQVKGAEVGITIQTP